MSSRPPAPQPTKQSSIAQTQVAVSNLALISAVISSGVLTQNRVNEIVAMAINSIRRGE